MSDFYGELSEGLTKARDCVIRVLVLGRLKKGGVSLLWLLAKNLYLDIRFDPYG